jgi:hypothetical protein
MEATRISWEPSGSLPRAPIASLYVTRLKWKRGDTNDRETRLSGRRSELLGPYRQPAGPNEFTTPRTERLHRRYVTINGETIVRRDDG